MKRLQRLRYSSKYILYRLSAKHRKGHGIHSPFIFKLITEVFNKKTTDTKLNEVYKVYDRYIKSKRFLNYKEMGAGSCYKSIYKARIGKIIRSSSVNKKYGRLIYHLVSYFECENMLELGTSVGISAAFISQANLNAHFTSIEGVPEKTEIAKEIANELRQNTRFVTGDFNQKLGAVLNHYPKIDFIYFDGNHTKDATLKYFELCLSKCHNYSVFVFDDIHWSREMEESWKMIKEHQKVRVSVDLFRLGLIFFKKELSKEHYIVKF